MKTNIDLKNVIDSEIKNHPELYDNINRKFLIQEAVHNKECIATECGALAIWTEPISTGRSPLDTVMVKRKENENTIDWQSPNNIAIEEETFDMLFEDAINFIKTRKRLYVTDRVIGADSSYALPVKTVSNKALTALFTDNMFRPIPKDIDKSIYANKPFYVLALPNRKLDSERYNGRLRKLANGKTSDLVIAIDYERGIGIVIGSRYLGSVKKMLFTVMNYYLPFENILPLHCSANEGKDGKTALLLGLSGTGKTTLSADPNRALIGDDEHGWSDTGIANFENGCYAKMIDIDPEKEPEIYDAVLHKEDYIYHGSIIENALMYPDGTFDFFDDRITPNSRASYPLSFLKNIKKDSLGSHPSTILFLTADAYGVLPPVSKLNKEQAMLWFLMGYTSKLAGTEAGVKEPQFTFSRFFGQPFMPSIPSVYANLLGEKMEKHNANVYLINTGWVGGKYGVGKRISLKHTRKIVEACINGSLEKVEYVSNDLFHINIPKTCCDVPSNILNPEDAWEDKQAFAENANKLAKAFSDQFDKMYGNKGLISNEIISQCPGK